MRLLHFKRIPYRTTNKHMRLNHRLRESDNEHFCFLLNMLQYLQYYTVTLVNGLSNYIHFLLRQIKHGTVLFYSRDYFIFLSTISQMLFFNEKL